MKPLVLALALALPATGLAASAHLTRSVAQGLATWGFGATNTSQMSNAKVSALYLLLNEAPPRFSPRASLFRQRLKTALNAKH